MTERVGFSTNWVKSGMLAHIRGKRSRTVKKQLKSTGNRVRLGSRNRAGFGAAVEQDVQIERTWAVTDDAGLASHLTPGVALDGLECAE